MKLTPAQRRFLDTLLAQGYSCPPFSLRRSEPWWRTARSLEAAGIIRVVPIRNANGCEAQLQLPAPAWVFSRGAPACTE